MSLREQLLSELRQQNEIAQQEIKDLEATISERHLLCPLLLVVH